VSVGPGGAIYLADTGNSRLQEWATPAGVIAKMR